MPAGAQYLYGEDPVALNVGRRTVRVRVSNTGDRAVQVGSHYHFFEANRELDFMRSEGYGMHLNIAAGTAVRFEPGDTRDVELCTYGGSEQLIGFSNLVDGRVADPDTRRTAADGRVANPCGAGSALSSISTWGLRARALGGQIPAKVATPSVGGICDGAGSM